MSDSEDAKYKDWYHTRFGFYPPDEKESNLVIAAKRGDMKQIKEIVSKSEGSKKASVLNHAKKWTEVQEKSCYDKSWEWFGDTALITSARNGNAEIVKFLLLEGADPTLSSCPYDDEYETALQAVQNRSKFCVKNLEKLKAGTYQIAEHEIECEPLKFVERIFENIATYESVIKLLEEAEKHWDKASYAHARYSKERAKAFAENPNMPKNYDEYRNAIEQISSETELDFNLVQGLASKFSLLQQKKRSLQPPSKTQYHQPQIPWMSKVQSQKKSNLVTSLSQSSNCPGCGKPPARECVNHSCGKCCSGSCPRHGTDMPVMYSSFWWD